MPSQRQTKNMFSSVILACLFLMILNNSPVPRLMTDTLTKEEPRTTMKAQIDQLHYFSSPHHENESISLVANSTDFLFPLGIHNVPTKCPPELNFTKGLPVTALFSFPGSGNTWVRHLLQLATGIYTGSVYNDVTLKKNGFKGESRIDDTVVAVKVHEQGDWPAKFNRTLLVYRHPAEAVLAEYKRRRVGHMRQYQAERIFNNKKAANKDFAEMLQWWLNSNSFWMLNFTRPLHIIQYSNLKTNLKQEMTKVLRFLDWEVSESQLSCMEQHSEGGFHRPRVRESFPHFFSNALIERAQECISEFDRMIVKRRQMGYVLTL